MRILPTLATLVAALALASCGGEANKELTTLNGDGFSVSMPGKPTKSEQSVPTPRGTVKAISYTSDSRDQAYSIGYTELPSGVTGDLTGAIRGGATNIGGTVRDERNTTHQGYKARDARITGAADNKGTVFMRAILAQHRLYVLQYIGDGANLEQPPAEYNQIRDSLKIDAAG